MPDLLRLYIRQVALGAALSAIFVALILGFDVAHLRHLVLTSPVGWIAVLMLWAFHTIVFAGVQFGIAVMAMQQDHRPRGGPGARQPVSIPVPVRDISRRR